jgi:hypothetical protein
MNVFASHACPVKSAQDHCNVHLVKQTTEAAQLLSTAHFVLDGKQVAMKPTHSNHPSAKWCRETKGNYLWLFEHYKALCEEYTYRTGKVHKSSEWLKTLSQTPVSIDDKPLSEFVFCGPDEFRMKSLRCVHGAYRLYLKHKFQDWTTRTDKKQMPVVWTNRNKPEWL